MQYEGRVFRPPSEAYSLILQTTIGCAHNQCTFCSMYKEKQFRVRPIESVISDLSNARKVYDRVDKIFLADGNALALHYNYLETLLHAIRQLFPECTRVSTYGSPMDILRKTEDELSSLKTLGLQLVYMGIESGSDAILSSVKKGVTQAQMIEAGQKMKRVGLPLSTMIISGLGGSSLWEEHALESAKVVSAIDPDYLGLLTLLVEPQTPLYEDVRSGRFQCLSPIEVLKETQLFLSHLTLSHTIFRSNHASNYVSLSGTLPKDKTFLCQQIDRALEKHFGTFHEQMRRL